VGLQKEKERLQNKIGKKGGREQKGRGSSLTKERKNFRRKIGCLGLEKSAFWLGKRKGLDGGDATSFK